MYLCVLFDDDFDRLIYSVHTFSMSLTECVVLFCPCYYAYSLVMELIRNLIIEVA